MHLVGTLMIDGVAHEVRLYPLADKTALQPQGQQPQTQVQVVPVPDGSVALPRTVTLIKYTTIEGISKTSGKPYTIHKFSGSDGLEYSTFKRDMALLLKINEPVRLFCNPDKMGRGFSIVSIAEPERRVV